MRDDEVYIVDWDIPKNPPSKKVAFYRRLNKIREKYGFLDDRMSTRSVLITTSRSLAFEVYELAVSYGYANLYIAKPIYPKITARP